MKKIFFAASLAFLALAWAVDADAAPRIPSSVTSAGPFGHCFVTTEGKIIVNGSYAFSEETGFSACAGVGNNGVFCGIKTDGTMLCNDSRFNLSGIKGGGFGNISWVGEISGGFWAINGGFTIKNAYGETIVNAIPSKTENYTMVRTFGHSVSYQYGDACWVNSVNGVATFWRQNTGVQHTQSNAISCAISRDSSGEKRFYTLKSDGSIISTGTNLFNGIYVEISNSPRNAICAIKTDGKPECYVAGSTMPNVPDFAVRDVVIGGQWNNGDWFACAVRKSDNKFGCWGPSYSFSVVTLADAGGQLPPEPTFGGPPGSTCRNLTIPDTSTIEWMDPGFFSIPGSSTSFSWSSATSPIPSNCTNSSVIQWAGGTKCGDVGTLTQTDGTNNDRVTVYNYFTGSNLVADSFTASGTSRSLLIRDDDTGVPVIKFNAMRDGVPYAANVWQFFGVQNPSAFKNWAFEIGADGSSVPVFATGSQATVLYGNGRSSVVLQLNDMAVAPRGMRIGKASGNVTKTQCESATTACEWTQATLTGAIVCTSIPKNGKIGQCSDQNGICAPTATGTTTPIENAYITYGPNGEVLAVTPPQEFKNPDGTLRSADIYSCPNTPPGFANWIDCLLEVGGNVTDLLTEGTSQLTGEGSGSVIGIAQKIGNSSGELSLTGVAPTGANLADDVFRRTWNESFVGTKNSPFRGFGVFALVISVILIIIAVIGAIGLAASKR